MKKLIALTLVLVFIIGCGQSSNYGSDTGSTTQDAQANTEIAQEVSNVDSTDTDLSEPDLDFNLDDW